MKAPWHVESLRRGFIKRIDELVHAEGGRLPHERAQCAVIMRGSGGVHVGFTGGSRPCEGVPAHLNPDIYKGSGG